MTQVAFACPLRLGTQERWRRLFQDIAGAHREQFDSSLRQVGMSQVQVRLVQRRRDALLLVQVEIQRPYIDLRELLNSRQPFERWLSDQLQILLGWDMQEFLTEKQEMLFSWEDEHLVL